MHPFLAFGRNALTAYVLSLSLDRLLNRWIVNRRSGVSVKGSLYVHTFAWWAVPCCGVEAASLMYAVAYVAVWGVVVTNADVPAEDLHQNLIDYTGRGPQKQHARLARERDLSSFIPKSDYCLLIDDQRLDELVRRSGARHIDAHRQHASRAPLQVDHVLRRLDGFQRVVGVGNTGRATGDLPVAVTVSVAPPTSSVRSTCCACCRLNANDLRCGANPDACAVTVTSPKARRTRRTSLSPPVTLFLRASWPRGPH